MDLLKDRFGRVSERMSTMDPPTIIGSSTPTVIMKLWNIGSSTTNRSWSTALNTCRQLSTLWSRLPCVSIAPLGRPVVPLV